MEHLSGLNAADLLRLESIARSRTLGVGEVEWSDLLSTALERVISGSRQWPRGLLFDRFLAQVMRSVASEHREHQRRVAKAGVVLEVDRRWADNSGQGNPIELVGSSSQGPEAELEAAETIAEIENIFKDDEHALAVVIARKEGLSPSEVQAEFGMTATQYDSATKRIRRAFLKLGLVGRKL